MGFLDFIKRRKNKDNEKIKFLDLDTWIAEKKDSLKDSENILIKNLKERIKLLSSELTQKNEKTKHLDMSGKKVEQKIKVISMENLNQYTLLLENLIKNLNDLNSDSFEKLVERANFLLLDFEKKSLLNYHKATLIIGKELEEIRDSLVKFSKNLKSDIEKNKETISLISSIKDLNDLLSDLNNCTSNLKFVKNEISLLTSRLAKQEEDSLKSEKKIKEIESSEIYEKYKKSLTYLEREKKSIDRLISSLINEIDFKKLSGIFHKNKDHFETIKSHQSKFRESFMKDNGFSIMNLLKESSLDTEEINKIFSDIQKTRHKISLIEIPENPSNKSLKNIENLQSSINLTKNGIEKEKKKITQIEEKSEEIKSKIKNNLEKLNITLEF